MARLAAAFFILVALGACNSYQQPPAAEPQLVTRMVPYQPGNGVVQAVIPAPQSALQRLEIRMDDGKVQYVDTESREFSRGSRIQLTEDRLIRRP